MFGGDGGERGCESVVDRQTIYKREEALMLRRLAPGRAGETGNRVVGRIVYIHLELWE